MVSLYSLSIWHGVHKLARVHLAAESFRGAATKAGRMVARHPMAKDVTHAVLSCKESVGLRKRRFYEDGAPISEWCDFTFVGEDLEDEV